MALFFAGVVVGGIIVMIHNDNKKNTKTKKNKNQHKTETKYAYDRLLGESCGYNTILQDTIGGSEVLSQTNMQTNNQSTIKTPQQLGFEVLTTHKEKYEQTLLYFMVNELVKSNKVIGYSSLSGYYVSIELTHTGKVNKELNILIPKGSVFEQKEWNKKQNLAAKKDKNITVKNGETVKFDIPCWCIDANYGSPSSNPMRYTVLLSNAAINNQDQSSVWSYTEDIKKK